MTDKQKDMLRILDETVAFYGEDPSRRAVDEHTSLCVYHTEDGRKCAVGRLLTPEEHLLLDEHDINSGCGAGKLMDGWRGLFPSLTHNWLFYNHLQNLHDVCKYWNYQTGGLSKDGKSRYETLKKNIIKGEYD